MERGQLKAFVIENVNLQAPSIREEARRLMPLAKKAKVHVSTLYVMDQTVRKVLRSAGSIAPDRVDGDGQDDGQATPHAGNGNGARAPLAPVIASQQYLRRLADTREMLTSLAAQVQATAEMVASLEAEEQSRSTRIEQIAQEWLGHRQTPPVE